MSSVKFKHGSGNSMSISAPTNNPASDLTLSLPSTVGTAGQVLSTDGNGNLSWISPYGIIVDRFRLDNNTSDGAELIIGGGNQSGNEGRAWERNDTTDHLAGFVTTGGQITDTAGVFSFPSTGIYYIKFHALIYTAGNDSMVRIKLQVTDDNGSSWNTAVDGRNGDQESSGIDNQLDIDFVMDVTNTTNHKVRFYTDSFSSNTAVRGSTTTDHTYVTFIKIGDT